VEAPHGVPHEGGSLLGTLKKVAGAAEHVRP
jgi:hypothetical protein